MPSENWQQALTGAASEEKQQEPATEPLPEAASSKERLTEIDTGDTPHPPSEAHESAQEKETEEPKDTDQVEKGQSDSLATTKPGSTQPPPIEAGDNSHQIVPAPPSSGLLTAFEVC